MKNRSWIEDLYRVCTKDDNKLFPTVSDLEKAKELLDSVYNRKYAVKIIISGDSDKDPDLKLNLPSGHDWDASMFDPIWWGADIADQYSLEPAPEPKCECGAHSVYGKGCDPMYHAADYCPLFKKN